MPAAALAPCPAGKVPQQPRRRRRTLCLPHLTATTAKATTARQKTTVTINHPHMAWSLVRCQRLVRRATHVYSSSCSRMPVPPVNQTYNFSDSELTGSRCMRLDCLVFCTCVAACPPQTGDPVHHTLRLSPPQSILYLHLHPHLHLRLCLRLQSAASRRHHHRRGIWRPADRLPVRPAAGADQQHPAPSAGRKCAGSPTCLAPPHFATPVAAPATVCACATARPLSPSCCDAGRRDHSCTL